MQIDQHILDILMTAEFEAWHDNEFDDYVKGEEGAPTKDGILKQIASVFRL